MEKIEYKNKKNENINNLFRSLERIYKKDEENAIKFGSKVNIFDMLDVKTNERKICHFIYELLNPKGCHKKNDVFLKLFLKDVIKLDDKLINKKIFNVWYEYPINTDKTQRWIDLYIESIDDEVKIPIEVKIWAKDQDRQCYDYYNEIFKKAKNDDTNENNKLYYLTIDNHWPTVASMDKMCGDIYIFKNKKWQKVNENDKVDDKYIFNNKNNIDIKGIKRITFYGEIVFWLDDCINKVKEECQKNKLTDILNQFIVNIKEISGIMGNKDVVKLLNKKRKYYRLYKEIKDAEFDFKKDWMDKCLEEINKEMKNEFNLSDYITVDDFDAEQSIYLEEGKAYPRIEWEVKKFENKNIYLCVEFSNDEGDDVNVGLRIRNKNMGYCKAIYKKIYGSAKSEDKDNKYWIESKSIKINNSIPSFSKGNDAFCDLLEKKENYNEFIKVIIGYADYYIDKIKKI